MAHLRKISFKVVFSVRSGRHAAMVSDYGVWIDAQLPQSSFQLVVLISKLPGKKKKMFPKLKGFFLTLNWLLLQGQRKNGAFVQIWRRITALLWFHEFISRNAKSFSSWSFLEGKKMLPTSKGFFLTLNWLLFQGQSKYDAFVQIWRRITVVISRIYLS